ncbi:APC family permease [Bergeyella sp. RCAD1439]|uniref:APC family permease n=1 Tax=Bergeyella anatis TaxID=3113737 RepID=UPI002E19122A|nr:APC family permease [Bergeyella sp. RCAD1439]
MEKTNTLNAKYGLFTAISMVVGQVIGSGIFFKVDDVLTATQGNIFAGLLGWILVGLSVILAAFSMAYYAALLPNDGGILNYVKFRFGPKSAAMVGWIYMSLFYPLLTAVLFTVSGIYLCQLIAEFINFQPTFAHYSAIGFLNLLFFAVFNIFQPKSSGLFQQITTVLKLIPLILISAMGLIWLLQDQPSEAATYTRHWASASEKGNLWLLVAASFIPISFAFDGWYVATQLSGEIKNAKKNLPKAMVIGTFVVALVYLLYYTGIVYGMKTDELLKLKDGYIAEFSRNLLGKTGAILIQLFIIISVLGTSNGLLLASTRVPYQFHNLEASKKFLNLGKLSERNVPVNSALLAIAGITFYLIVFYLTNTLTVFTSVNFDLSAVPIAFMYMVNGALFLGLFRLIRKQTFQGRKAPKYLMVTGALLGVVLVLTGTATAPNGWIYIAISAAFVLLGLLVIRKPNTP